MEYEGHGEVRREKFPGDAAMIFDARHGEPGFKDSKFQGFTGVTRSGDALNL